MDTNTIFTKTAKGAGAAAGKSKELARDDRALLNAIDGLSSAGALAQRLGLPEAQLCERLASLAAADYIRAFTAPDDALEDEFDLGPVPVLEEAMGAATISAFLRETEWQAQQAAEDRFSREMQDTQPDAGGPARREADELARRKAAVARIRREALEKYRHDLACREQEEAERQRRLQAEEQARLAAQEEARREAERQARLAAEQRAREEAEALARRRADEQARHEAELEARREAEEEARLLAERSRQEQEERARREAARLAERAAREQAKRTAKARAREQAAERAQRKAAQQSRRALQRAEREAREKELRELQEQTLAVDAAIAHASKPATVWLTELTAPPADPAAPGHDDAYQGETAPAAGAPVPEPVLAAANRDKLYRKPSRWRLPVGLALCAALAAGIVLVQAVPFEGQRAALERQAGAAFGQPVNIGKVRLAWLPLPHWRIENVVIGANGQIRVAQVDAIARLDTLAGGRMAYSSVTLASPVVDEEGLGWLLFAKARPQAIAFDQVSAHQARLVSPRITLPPFEIEAALDRDGNWTGMTLHDAERQVRIGLRPQGAAVAFDLRTDAFASAFGPVFGGTLALGQFSASGHATRSGMTLSAINGALLGGGVTGSARLRWGGGWTLDGSFKALRIDAARLAPALFESGKLDGSADVAWKAPAASGLLAAPRVSGDVSVRDGVLRGVDLAGVVRDGDSRGKTLFSELDAGFVHERGKLRLHKLRLNAGLLAAAGNAEVDAGGKLDGRFAIDIKTSSRQARGHIGLDGTLSQPRFE